MKVAIIFLDYMRHDHTPAALKNLTNAGHPFDLFTIDVKGVARAINDGIYRSAFAGCVKQCVQNYYYDAVVTMANDITMPDGWLKSMVHAMIYDNAGIIGIHTVEALPEKDINGMHPTFMPFGNVLITRDVIAKIGFFNEDHDPYGMQDSDYGYRATKAGFYNFYLPNMKAEHIGHDVGDTSEYRKMKDAGLAIAGEKYTKWCDHYDKTGNYYLPFNQ